MQMPEFESGKFATLVESKEYKKAIQTLMGIGDKPVHYARALIKCIEELVPTDRQSLFEWCEAPMEPQPVGELQWYVDQIARHEIGHAVVAKLLAFQTGAITLMLKAANGDHVATAATPLYTSTPTTMDLESYLERRIMVLLAGTMSEAESVEMLESEFSISWKEPAAESDRQKAEELIQVLMNMRGRDGVSEKKHCFRELVEKTRQIVSKHHPLISSVAKALSGRIEHFGQLVTWSAEELDDALKLNNRNNPLVTEPLR